MIGAVYHDDGEVLGAVQVELRVEQGLAQFRHLGAIDVRVDFVADLGGFEHAVPLPDGGTHVHPLDRPIVAPFTKRVKRGHVTESVEVEGFPGSEEARMGCRGAI